MNTKLDEGQAAIFLGKQHCLFQVVSVSFITHQSDVLNNDS